VRHLFVSLSNEGEPDEAHAGTQEHVQTVQRAIRVAGQAGDPHGGESWRAQVLLSAVLLRHVERAGYDGALCYEAPGPSLQQLHRLQQGVSVEGRHPAAHVQAPLQPLHSVHRLQTHLQELQRPEGAYPARPSKVRLPMRYLQATSRHSGLLGGAHETARGRATHRQS